MTEAERAAVRSRPFAAPACQPILERLEWKAWSTLLWGLDAGDKKVLRFYLDTFRRMPDGSVRARPLPRVQPLCVKPIRPPTVKKLAAQDRRRAVESARVVAAEAIVADIHARGSETYAALAAVLPAWRRPPTWKPRSHRPHRSYRSQGSYGAPRARRPAPRRPRGLGRVATTLAAAARRDADGIPPRSRRNPHRPAPACGRPGAPFTMPPVNVLLITADQFRADCLGCSGADFLATPNYDRLAAEGVRFTRAFASNPICVPARATLTTGNHAHKCTGSKDNDGRIREGQPKLAELFAAAGYETYALGKLHYVPYQLPRLVHGFRHWELTESGRLMWQSAREGWAIGTEEYYEHLRAAGWTNMYRAHGVGNNDVRGTVSALPAELNVDHWVVDRSIHHLERHLAERPGVPFFMWTSFPKPHSPYDPPEPWHRLYDPRAVPPPAGSPELLAGRNPELRSRPLHYCWDLLSPEQVRLARARYYGLISFQDEQVGRLLRFLAGRGILDETAILFTADHGDLLGDFGCFFKSCFLAGSEHIPLILRAPGLPAGAVRHALAGTEDVLPTLCELAGIAAPEGIDGRSLARAAREGARDGRELYVAQTGNSPEQGYMVTDGRWKYCYSELEATEELYNLEDDPQELRNLAAEGAGKTRAHEFRGAVIDWCRRNGDAAMLDRSGDLVRSAFDARAERPRLPGHFGWRPF